MNRKLNLKVGKYSSRSNPASIHVVTGTPQFFAVSRGDSIERRGITNCGVVLGDFPMLTRHWLTLHDFGSQPRRDQELLGLHRIDLGGGGGFGRVYDCGAADRHGGEV